MIHYQTVRRPVCSSWRYHPSAIARHEANQQFYQTLSSAQKNFLESAYSWTLDRNGIEVYLAVTVTTDRELTLANLLF